MTETARPLPRVLCIAAFVAAAGPVLAQGRGQTVQRLGPITFSTAAHGQVSVGVGPQGEMMFTLAGSPLVTLDPAAGSTAGARVDLRADRIQFSVSADYRTIRGTAEGHVRMTQVRTLAAASGVRAGQSRLEVTGARAVLSFRTMPANSPPPPGAQTVEFTGSPQVTLTHPRLAAPAVTRGARIIHVDLANSTFNMEAGDESLSMTFEPAENGNQGP